LMRVWHLAWGGSGQGRPDKPPAPIGGGGGGEGGAGESQLHIVFILSSVTRYSEPLNRRLCGTSNWSGPLGVVIHLLPVSGIEQPILRCHIHSFVTTQTILAWLPTMEVLPLYVTQFLIS